jgi:hypothetical protein
MSHLGELCWLPVEDALIAPLGTHISHDSLLLIKPLLGEGINVSHLRRSCSTLGMTSRNSLIPTEDQAAEAIDYACCRSCGHNDGIHSNDCKLAQSFTVYSRNEVPCSDSGTGMAPGVISEAFNQLTVKKQFIISNKGSELRQESQQDNTAQARPKDPRKRFQAHQPALNIAGKGTNESVTERDISDECNIGKPAGNHLQIIKGSGITCPHATPDYLVSHVGVVGFGSTSAKINVRSSGEGVRIWNPKTQTLPLPTGNAAVKSNIQPRTV